MVCAGASPLSRIIFGGTRTWQGLRRRWPVRQASGAQRRAVFVLVQTPPDKASKLEASFKVFMELKVNAWPQDQCRWVLRVAASGDGAAPDPSSLGKESGLPAASRWVYLCSRDPTGQLFARYRRPRHAGSRRNVAPAAGGSRAAAVEPAPQARRACPCCNGWVYRVPRRFVDGLTHVHAPVHRYRCRSPGCSWEGNLPVRQSRPTSTSGGFHR
jgi:hypothetical protein